MHLEILQKKKIFRKNRQHSSITCKRFIKIFEDWRASHAENGHFKKLFKSKKKQIWIQKMSPSFNKWKLNWRNIYPPVMFFFVFIFCGICGFAQYFSKKSDCIILHKCTTILLILKPLKPTKLLFLFRGTS